MLRFLVSLLFIALAFCDVCSDADPRLSLCTNGECSDCCAPCLTGGAHVELPDYVTLAFKIAAGWNDVKDKASKAPTVSRPSFDRITPICASSGTACYINNFSPVEPTAAAANRPSADAVKASLQEWLFQAFTNFVPGGIRAVTPTSSSWTPCSTMSPPSDELLQYLLGIALRSDDGVYYRFLGGCLIQYPVSSPPPVAIQLGFPLTSQNLNKIRAKAFPTDSYFDMDLISIVKNPNGDGTLYFAGTLYCANGPDTVCRRTIDCSCPADSNFGFAAPIPQTLWLANKLLEGQIESAPTFFAPNGDLRFIDIGTLGDRYSTSAVLTPRAVNCIGNFRVLQLFSFLLAKFYIQRPPVIGASAVLAPKLER